MTRLHIWGLLVRALALASVSCLVVQAKGIGRPLARKLAAYDTAPLPEIVMAETKRHSHTGEESFDDTPEFTGLCPVVDFGKRAISDTIAMTGSHSVMVTYPFEIREYGPLKAYQYSTIWGKQLDGSRHFVITFDMNETVAVRSKITSAKISMSKYWDGSEHHHVCLEHLYRFIFLKDDSYKYVEQTPDNAVKWLDVMFGREKKVYDQDLTKLLKGIDLSKYNHKIRLMVAAVHNGCLSAFDSLSATDSKTGPILTVTLEHQPAEYGNWNYGTCTCTDGSGKRCATRPCIPGISNDSTRSCEETKQKSFVDCYCGMDCTAERMNLSVPPINLDSSLRLHSKELWMHRGREEPKFNLALKAYTLAGELNIDHRRDSIIVFDLPENFGKFGIEHVSLLLSKAWDGSAHGRFCSDHKYQLSFMDGDSYKERSHDLDFRSIMPMEFRITKELRVFNVDVMELFMNSIEFVTSTREIAIYIHSVNPECLSAFNLDVILEAELTPGDAVYGEWEPVGKCDAECLGPETHQCRVRSCEAGVGNESIWCDTRNFADVGPCMEALPPCEHRTLCEVPTPRPNLLEDITMNAIESVSLSLDETLNREGELEVRRTSTPVNDVAAVADFGELSFNNRDLVEANLEITKSSGSEACNEFWVELVSDGRYKRGGFPMLDVVSGTKAILNAPSNGQKYSTSLTPLLQQRPFETTQHQLRLKISPVNEECEASFDTPVVKAKLNPTNVTYSPWTVWTPCSTTCRAVQNVPTFRCRYRGCWPAIGSQYNQHCQQTLMFEQDECPELSDC